MNRYFQCKLLILYSILFSTPSSLAADKPNGTSSKTNPKINYCKKYENKLIGYYEKIFLVKNCKREAIEDIQKVNKMIKKVGSVSLVDGDVIKNIPAKKIDDSKSFLSCKEVNNRVVLTLSQKIFYVKDCKKTEIPDWETYLAYKKAGKLGKENILEVEEKDLINIKGDKEYTSVLVKEFKDYLLDDESYDIIPAKRACKGIEGKFVTYYSKIYKIESCKRREVSLDYWNRKGRKGSKKIELTASQWLSIPEGKNLN